MNHPSELLADLMDGTLDADTRARVEAHLSTCQSCREDLAAATAGRDALRTLAPASAPTDLPDRVKAAAAGLAALIAFSLPDIGGGPAGDASGGFESVGSAVGTASTEEVPLEVRDGEDYGQEDLERLASEARALSAPAAPQTDAADTDRAAACVTGAFEGQPSGQIVRLIRARFQGRRAYVAVYLEGPGADQPPDTATVWVAALDDCTILSFAQARI